MWCVFRFITWQLPVYRTLTILFRRIFLRNYNSRISEIWFQDLYKSAIPCDAFSDSSLDNFLFTEHLPFYFVTFFSGTTIQGFLKFGFRIYISQVYRVMRFQIHHSTTFCLPNTCMILHVITKLKISITFFSGTTIQGFLKFCFKVYISMLYRVMRFQIHHSTTSCLPNTYHFISSHFSQEL